MVNVRGHMLTNQMASQALRSEVKVRAQAHVCGRLDQTLYGILSRYKELDVSSHSLCMYSTFDPPNNGRSRVMRSIQRVILVTY